MALPRRAFSETDDNMPPLLSVRGLKDSSTGVLVPCEVDGLDRLDATVETRTVSGSESDWVVVRLERERVLRWRGVAVVVGEGMAVDEAVGA